MRRSTEHQPMAAVERRAATQQLQQPTSRKQGARCACASPPSIPPKNAVGPHTTALPSAKKRIRTGQGERPMGHCAHDLKHGRQAVNGVSHSCPERNPSRVQAVWRTQSAD
eukprot:scaffold84667_cov31-Tisochrysis_lutea.AAC.4